MAVGRQTLLAVSLLAGCAADAPSVRAGGPGTRSPLEIAWHRVISSTINPREHTAEHNIVSPRMRIEKVAASCSRPSPAVPRALREIVCANGTGDFSVSHFWDSKLAEGGVPKGAPPTDRCTTVSNAYMQLRAQGWTANFVPSTQAVEPHATPADLGIVVSTALDGGAVVHRKGARWIFIQHFDPSECLSVFFLAER